MQRHSRRVPVSFFSRYTKDIVHFADRYTDGKVVSVLEGGYSDRALMSAGMGHVIGMLGRQGEKGWWEEAELCNVSIPSSWAICPRRRVRRCLYEGTRGLKEAKADVPVPAREGDQEETHGQDRTFSYRNVASPAPGPHSRTSGSFRRGIVRRGSTFRGDHASAWVGFAHDAAGPEKGGGRGGKRDASADSGQACGRIRPQRDAAR